MGSHRMYGNSQALFKQNVYESSTGWSPKTSPIGTPIDNFMQWKLVHYHDY